MGRLERSTRERLDRWERALRDALEQTQIEEEKRRLERELVELGQARLDLSSMDPAEIERLHERLARDPSEWVSHHATSMTPTGT